MKNWIVCVALLACLLMGSIASAGCPCCQSSAIPAPPASVPAPPAYLLAAGSCSTCQQNQAEETSHKPGQPVRNVLRAKPVRRLFGRLFCRCGR